MSGEIAPAVVTPAPELAWSALLSAARLAESLDRAGRAGAFAVDQDGGLRPVGLDSSDIALTWQPGDGWHSRLPATDSRADRFDLYLPLCSATSVRPITIGHLGQSLDGFIATESGDSQFVTGQANLVHMHWLRGLCDAVVVGAGTVAADDPRLTTRHVAGPHPLRVIFDPARRLTPTYRVFTDAVAPTLYCCREELVAPGEQTIGQASVVGVPSSGPGGAPAALVELLRARGCARIFVEGGGVTVSAFLEAGLLDRLHLAVAPVLIGGGRPAIRLRPPLELRDCPRPAYRIYRMGGDVLFDCDLRAGASPDVRADVSRIL